MYKYTANIRGWKTDSQSGGTPAGGLSHVSIKPFVTSSTIAAGVTSPDVEQYIDEVEGEGGDRAAPLPQLTSRGVTGERGGSGSGGNDVPDGLVVSDAGDVEGSTGGGGGGTVMFAKDKRKLREKRRSTGVAKFTAEEIADSETANNTSLNEHIHHDDIIGYNTHLVTSTLGNGHANHIVDTNDATSPDIITMTTINRHVSDVTSPGVTVPHHATDRVSKDLDISATEGDTSVPHRSGILPGGGVGGANMHSDPGNSSRNDHSSVELITSPLIDQHKGTSSGMTSPPRTPGKPTLTYPKPCLKQSPATKPSLPQKPSHTQTQSQASAAVQEALAKRIRELEKMLEVERKENAELISSLSERDKRIKELVQEVTALNEDLDAADEEYDKLEAENSAILRAMAQLTINSTSVAH